TVCACKGGGLEGEACLPLLYLGRSRPALRHLRDRPDQLRIDLGLPVKREEPVPLLLDVGQLRIAETLDGPGAHQRCDHHAVCPPRPTRAADPGKAPPPGAGERHPAELTDDKRLASVSIAGQVRLVRGADSPSSPVVPCEGVVRGERRVEALVAARDLACG